MDESDGYSEKKILSCADLILTNDVVNEVRRLLLLLYVAALEHCSAFGSCCPARKRLGLEPRGLNTVHNS